MQSAVSQENGLYYVNMNDHHMMFVISASNKSSGNCLRLEGGRGNAPDFYWMTLKPVIPADVRGHLKHACPSELQPTAADL